MSDNVQVINDAYEAFQRGDIPSLLENVSDEVQWNAPGILPQGGDYHGRDGVGAFFAAIGENWSELQIKFDDLIADGPLVISLGQARGKLSSGGETAYGFCHAFTLDDGQITRFREYVAVDDTLG